MKKIDWDHAMTRRDYAYLCGWIYGIAIAFYAISIVIIHWGGDIKDWIGDRVDWIKKKTSKIF